MPLFLVDLSLRATSHDYAHLWQAMNKAQGQRVMDTTWLVDVHQNVQTLTNALLSLCAPGDRLFVLEFAANASWSGTGLDDDTKAWLAQRTKIVSAGEAAKGRKSGLN